VTAERTQGDTKVDTSAKSSYELRSNDERGTVSDWRRRAQTTVEVGDTVGYRKAFLQSTVNTRVTPRSPVAK
jgi:hypothetical protein